MEQKPFSIRPMGRTDLNRVAELEKICFRSPWSKNALASELKNHLARYCVVEIDGIVVGYAGMWLIFDEAHITNVAIAPEARGQGYGRALMKHMMELAASLDAEHMTLEVRAGNEPAQALYASLGFVKAGVRKGYYTDTGEDAFILWLNGLNDLKPHSDNAI